MAPHRIEGAVTGISHGALRFARRPPHQRCACATLQSAWADGVSGPVTSSPRVCARVTHARFHRCDRGKHISYSRKYSPYQRDLTSNTGLISGSTLVEDCGYPHAYFGYSPVPDSDSVYHRLFSHPRMVEELVREFVPEVLAAGLDFSGLQRINPKFHVGRHSARRRESDVIWRLPTRDGVDVYLYLLIEFQKIGRAHV